MGNVLIQLPFEKHEFDEAYEKFKRTRDPLVFLKLLPGNDVDTLVEIIDRETILEYPDTEEKFIEKIREWAREALKESKDKSDYLADGLTIGVLFMIFYAKAYSIYKALKTLKPQFIRKFSRAAYYRYLDRLKWVEEPRNEFLKQLWAIMKVVEDYSRTELFINMVKTINRIDEVKKNM